MANASDSAAEEFGDVGYRPASVVHALHCVGFFGFVAGESVFAEVFGFAHDVFGHVDLRLFAGVAKLNPGCVSSDGALLCLAAAAPGVAARSSKGGPGGSGRGVQQDKSPRGLRTAIGCT